MSKHQKAVRSGSPRDEREGGSGPLGEAAQALEREIRRFDELTSAARRLSLDTRKGLERAAKATTDAAHAQEGVPLALGALVRAIQDARERHEANVAALQARGEEIRVRAEEVGALHERYAALGEEGKAIHELVQDAAAKQRDATTPAQLRDLADAIGGIDARMATLVESARALGQAATEASVTDIAEQAEALRQQVASTRNKVGLLGKSLHARLPN